MKRWRYSLPAFLLICTYCGIIYLLSPAYVDLTGMLPSDVHLECERHISENTQLRITYIVYAGKVSGQQIDPNNWTDGPIAYEYPLYRNVVVPYMDYEVSHDSGQSWVVYWRFPSERYYYVGPDCNEFGQLDETHFWMWNGHGIAITYDGGHHWVRRSHNDLKISNAWGSHIQSLDFTDANTGRLTQSDGPDLITTNGGFTWHEESAS